MLKHCQDGKHISDGSLFTDTVQVVNRSTQLVAVGVNCCSPALVEPLLDSAGSVLSPDTHTHTLDLHAKF